MSDFYTKLVRAVPPHKEMVDVQFRAMDENRRIAFDGLEEFLSGDDISEAELDDLRLQARERLAAVSRKEEWCKMAEFVAEALRGLIFTTGDGLYWTKEMEGGIAEGVSFPITEGKTFTPAFATALFSRMWPIVDKEKFLEHAYGWYVKALAVFPEHFAREEWRLVMDSEGELVIQLTGKKEARPPHDPNFVRATVIRRPAKKKR